jgi:hypothetical protein
MTADKEMTSWGKFPFKGLFGVYEGMDMVLRFELILLFILGNKTLSQTQLFFPNFFPTGRTGPKCII